MLESTITLGTARLYLRHNELQPDRTTVLLVHGLGDSGLAYREVFDEPQLLASCNLLVPDLIGYGLSSRAAPAKAGFTDHVATLQALLDHVNAGRVVVVGHSMGGDLTTLLCASDRSGRLVAYVNIEGDITPHDLFISGRAVEAGKAGSFETWFRHTFMEQLVLREWGQERPSSLRYYESLRLCDPQVFLANARELVRRNTTRTGECESEIGALYCSLHIPKVYCYGTDSLSAGSLAFLEQHGLEKKAFSGAGHAVMVDVPETFYPFLAGFIASVK